MGLLVFTHKMAYDRGVDKTTQSYEKRMTEERVRIRDANQAAVDQARRNETVLRKQIEQQDAEISKLEEEATKDPDADRPSISPDGVRRLNRVR